VVHRLTEYRRKEDELLTAYTDGAAEPNPGPSGIGVVVRDDEGRIVATISRAIGHGTTNKAEYFAAALGIKKAADCGAQEILVRTDSKLVVEQLSGRWKVKCPDLRRFHARVLRLISELGIWVTFEWIPRDENAEADVLANRAIGVEGNSWLLRMMASRA
jgi:ribonuclease H / adenosylcobalamin/alpha-ribazole phosphatase